MVRYLLRPCEGIFFRSRIWCEDAYAGACTTYIQMYIYIYACKIFCHYLHTSMTGAMPPCFAIPYLEHELHISFFICPASVRTESHGFAKALVVQQRSQQLLQPCKGILFRSRVWWEEAYAGACTTYIQMYMYIYIYIYTWSIWSLSSYVCDKSDASMFCDTIFGTWVSHSLFPLPCLSYPGISLLTWCVVWLINSLCLCTLSPHIFW